MDVPAALVAWLRATAAAVGADIAEAEGPESGMAVVPRESGAVVALADRVVVKVHRPGTGVEALARRLRLAAELPGLVLPPLAGPLVVPPLVAPPAVVPPDVGLPGQVATVWPRVQVLDPQEVEVPWAAAARTLAGLHLAPVPPDATGLRHGGAERLDRALERLAALATEAGPAHPAQVVLAAGHGVRGDVERGHVDRLPNLTPEGSARLVHGDWHLGQLGSMGSGWVLLDVDDLGTGDPAWDLARPAGFWGAGLLDDADWSAFLAAYRAAGGPAVPATGDPWPRLDVPARAAVVVAAARELLHPEPDLHDLDALVTACAQMPR